MKKKYIFIGLGVIALGAIIYFTATQGSRNAVAVQTGEVIKRDLATVVSASGEIKPKTFVNVGANAFGKITKLYVKEGAHVKQGQLLAQLENVQSSADVAAQRAGVGANQTDAVAAEAAVRTAQADYNRAKADAERMKQDFDRAEGLFKSQLISRADYDSRKAAHEVAVAQVAQAQARVAQAKAQQDSASGRVAQARATLTRASDQLSKTTYLAPFEGVVTNLPVREGESVVVGIQNSPGSTLMTIADMSVITAEVKVDETDIVNVKIGQPAEVKIDAIPDKTFKGTVSEIGNNAVLRSSGLATSQTTSGSQEAKDFKVVVTLENPPDNLRPGLSATAKITTASKSDVLAIPIQALTIRTEKELQTTPKGKDSAQAAAPEKSKAGKKDEEIQGVFKLEGQKVKFVPVKTGITGSTEIEVLSGLSEKDKIVTGSYKVLRTLKNGTSVKEDKDSAKKDQEKS
ncbi:MAG TPA: efflux RND transporter periplasmic adaptor subunit [Terriglobales bacterium]|nr:efflux RND transporter periplasmic adaptor subunit [Terriglobales bacterium]